MVGWIVKAEKSKEDKMDKVNNVDIVYGASWGDEGKGKVSHFLANRKNPDGTNYYDFVARWAGGSNAGHTIYHEGRKFATHIVPSGVFFNITSLIGPNCVLNIESFYKEIAELEAGGIDTSLVKVHPKCHIVTGKHIEEDKQRYAERMGTTSQGIAPAYRDKYGRTGLLVQDSKLDQKFIFRDKLHGNVLCEGAQGFHLDINYGNYPFVTSSETLPYAACSLGFGPKKIRNIYASAKIYDTRSGEDPLFPSCLLENPKLLSIADAGKEYGVTTGRRRKVNWLNLDKLVEAVQIGGATHLIVNKCDILEQTGHFKLYYDRSLIEFSNLSDMQSFITQTCKDKCDSLEEIYYSSNPHNVEGLIYE
jgi:adenylosuccinate synthase